MFHYFVVVMTLEQVHLLLFGFCFDCFIFDLLCGCAGDRRAPANIDIEVTVEGRAVAIDKPKTIA